MFRRLGWIWLVIPCALALSRAQAQKSEPTSDSFTFLHTSRLAIGDAPEARSLAALAQEGKALPQSPAFLVVSGDVTAQGRPAEFTVAQKEAESLRSSAFGFYAVPGVRDVRRSPLAKEGFAGAFGKLYQSFDHAGVHFVLLDSTSAQQPWGHLDTPQLKWLEKDFSRVRPETPILVFLHHQVGREDAFSRPLDNEYELYPFLTARNVIAVFTGQTAPEPTWTHNGIAHFASRGLERNEYHQVTVTRLTVTVERRALGKAEGAVLARVPIRQGARSLLRAEMDDAMVPFLLRRHVKAELIPRALSDSPEQEKGEYRINDGAWKPLKRDSRDIWRDMFYSKDVPIGVHLATARVTTAKGLTLERELIFEVERNFDEPNQKWAFNAEGPVQGDPVLANDLLIVASLDSKVYGLDRERGRKKWAFSTKGTFLASPVLATDTVYIGGTDGFFYALDAKSGRQRWRYEVGSPVQASAAVAQEVVCFGGNGKIVGLNANNGTPRWSATTQGHFQSRAATDGEAFYLGGWDNRVYALEAKTGTIRWQTPLATEGDSGAPAVASPAVDNGRVYVVTLSQKLYALDSRTGSILWSVAAPGEGDPFGLSSPVVFGTTLYLAGDGEQGDVYALDAATGRLLWRKSTGQRIALSSPKLAPNGQSLAIMSLRGRVSILDTAQGKALWRYELGPGNIFSTPEYDGNNVYTATMANDIQAINAPGVVKPISRRRAAAER